jgi:hypothetical protein
MAAFSSVAEVITATTDIGTAVGTAGSTGTEEATVPAASGLVMDTAADMVVAGTAAVIARMRSVDTSAMLFQKSFTPNAYRRSDEKRG